MIQSIDQYFIKTKIPMPNIDWKSLWPENSIDLSDNHIRWKEYRNLLGLWDSDTTNKLIDIKLFPVVVRIFRWQPGRFFPWHIDGTNQDIVNFAINWVLEGKGSIQWDSKLNLPRTLTGLSYASKLGKFTDEFEYETFGHGCIVNTSIPHRVVNLNRNRRVSVSMTFNKKITYNEAIEILKSNDLLEI